MLLALDVRGRASTEPRPLVERGSVVSRVTIRSWSVCPTRAVQERRLAEPVPP